MARVKIVKISLLKCMFCKKELLADVSQCIESFVGKIRFSLSADRISSPPPEMEGLLLGVSIRISHSRGVARFQNRGAIV